MIDWNVARKYETQISIKHTALYKKVCLLELILNSSVDAFR